MYDNLLDKGATFKKPHQFRKVSLQPANYSKSPLKLKEMFSGRSQGAKKASEQETAKFSSTSSKIFQFQKKLVGGNFLTEAEKTKIASQPFRVWRKYGKKTLSRTI